MALTIGVDVGGTTVAAGVFDEQGSVLATALRDTPSDDPTRTEDVIADVVLELAGSPRQRESVSRIVPAMPFVRISR